MWYRHVVLMMLMTVSFQRTICVCVPDIQYIYFYLGSMGRMYVCIEISGVDRVQITKWGFLLEGR